MDIELVSIDDLDLDPKNARKHDAKNLKAIADSLEQFGQRKPIVVWGKTVVAGNGTMAAARTLGWKQIEIVRVPGDWSSDQVKAYALADNRSAELAVWDEQVLASQLLELQEAEFDIELLGFELPVEELAEVVEDELPEQVEPKSKLGDVWKLGRHRLMCGDSGDEASLQRLLNNQRIDSIVTDPPYGIGIDGQKKSVSANPKHNRKEHEFRDWDSERPSKDLFDLILKQNVATVIWGGNYFADYLPATRGWIYWDKGQDGLTMSDGELAWTTENKPLRAITVNRAALIGSVHPTQKPLQVILFALDYLTSSKFVLDLFGGSGSTLIACEQTDRTCFMMELDPKYVDVIIARWEKLTGLTAELITD
jgi:site-specific DNA-methyltransferase (adenine-specific)